MRFRNNLHLTFSFNIISVMLVFLLTNEWLWSNKQILFKCLKRNGYFSNIIGLHNVLCLKVNFNCSRLSYSRCAPYNLRWVKSAWSGCITQNRVSLILSNYILMRIISNKFKLTCRSSVPWINKARHWKSQPRLVHLVIQINNIRFYKLALVLVVFKTYVQITFKVWQFNCIRHSNLKSTTWAICSRQFNFKQNLGLLAYCFTKNSHLGNIYFCWLIWCNSQTRWNFVNSLI